MKLTTLILASTLLLSSSAAFAQSMDVFPRPGNGSVNGQSGGTLTNGVIGNSMQAGGRGITGIASSRPANSTGNSMRGMASGRFG